VNGAEPGGARRKKTASPKDCWRLRGRVFAEVPNVARPVLREPLLRAFEWNFNRDDLAELMDRLAAREPKLRQAA
jgi:hypothetical protein